MKGALAKYGALPLTGTLSVQIFSMLLLDGQLGGNHFGPCHEHDGDAETVRSLKRVRFVPGCRGLRPTTFRCLEYKIF